MLALFAIIIKLIIDFIKFSVTFNLPINSSAFLEKESCVSCTWLKLSITHGKGNPWVSVEGSWVSKPKVAFEA